MYSEFPSPLSGGNIRSSKVSQLDSPFPWDDLVLLSGWPNQISARYLADDLVYLIAPDNSLTLHCTPYIL